MPRAKSARPKRNSDETVKPSKRRKRYSTSKKRRILASFPENVVCLKTLFIPWSGPQEFGSHPVMVFHTDEDDVVVTLNETPIQIPSSVCVSLSSNHVVVVLEKTLTTEHELCLNIGVKLPFPNARFLVESLYNKDYSQFSDTTLNLDTSKWRQLFRDLEEIQKARPTSSTSFQHDDLVPVLRGYQSAAVQWMLEREKSPGDLDLSWLGDVADTLSGNNGNLVLYAKYAGNLYPNVENIPTESGGILADEMGLGKTVVTLALILNNTNSTLADWQMVESPNKRTSTDYDSDGELHSLNQESCLDANEELQLVTSKLAKGVLRSKLNAWYESKLAEMSVVRRTPKKRSTVFFCLCGDKAGGRKNIVTCKSCGLIQHGKCCGQVNEETYVCPSCWKIQHAFPSRATLIIVPPAIFMQWASEVERHTPKLKLMQYNGVKDGFLQPTHLANHDVVLTTYTVLRAESMYAQEESSLSLRRNCRYMRATSPLEKVAWWRIVCDEAQMVESDISVVRAMTQRLSATHRWCVTGTPIQRNVADLYYLTSFMGLGALDNKELWTDLLLKPYLAGCKSPLLSVLKLVFWRSTKDHVYDELDIPEQSILPHYLKFTAIEDTFYMQEHGRSADAFAAGIRKSGLDVTRTIHSVDKGTLNKLLQPLLNTRQACTHAQVVKGINITCSSNAANLGELVTYLIKKTKQECEESLRQHVAALNGLAGLCCLNDDWSTAMEHYRMVLRLADEYKTDDARIDPLQRIHAMHNAAEVLKNHVGCAPPTLRDSALPHDIKELETKYLKKSEDLLSSARLQAQAASEEVDALVAEFRLDQRAWWVPVIMSCGEFESELVDKLHETLNSIDHTHKAAAKTFLSKVSGLIGIKLTIGYWLDTIEKNHKAVRSGIDTLMEMPSGILEEEALGCHLRESEDNRHSCQICKMERKMQNLECELFDTTRKEIQDREKSIDGALTKGSWKPSYEERTVKVILAFARGKASIEKMVSQDGKHFIRMLDAMKKEFRQTRAAWTALNHRIHALDEIAMAKTRLRRAELATQFDEGQINANLIYSAQIPEMMVTFEADRDASFSEFRKKQGKLLYLQNLAKDRNATPEACPICKGALEQQWCVLNCGHCYCIECLQALHKHGGSTIKCPVCREVTQSQTIGFVDTSGNNVDSDISVTGDFSTKVDNIVREILRLVADDPLVKILIFSTWTSVFSILQQALSLNHIKFRLLPSGKHQQILKEFRDAASGITALLLPLAWGAKGLNLVEATHVFLVEPILNPSVELQAIGRVHRIGQTKPTFVHRFIIKNTVEEKIFSSVSEAQDTWSKQKATISDLQRLFVISRQQLGDVPNQESA